ncbi:MAG: polysaccharide deacetylase family protein [Muribaculaceae bacterium]|nr:polysaccharide deacetylase family protein [Muribaculaceae bacterium]
MKKLLLSLVAMLLALSATAQLEQDSCGVVCRIGTEKQILLVITGHYSVDDNGYTENFDGVEKVLDVLKDKGVKGHFFPTGIALAQPKYEGSIRRIIADGHYLSGHSYGHLLLCDTNGRTLVTRDSVVNDLRLMEAQLERFGLAKTDYCIMMPPYETCNSETAGFYQDEGYELITPTWGLLTGQDWTRPESTHYYSADVIEKQLWQYERDHTLNGVILLIHAMDYPWRQPDDRPYNRLGEIIDKARSLGYEFVGMGTSKQ